MTTEDGKNLAERDMAKINQLADEALAKANQLVSLMQHLVDLLESGDAET